MHTSKASFIIIVKPINLVKTFYLKSNLYFWENYINAIKTYFGKYVFMP